MRAHERNVRPTKSLIQLICRKTRGRPHLVWLKIPKNKQTNSQRIYWVVNVIFMSKSGSNVNVLVTTYSCTYTGGVKSTKSQTNKETTHRNVSTGCYTTTSRSCVRTGKGRTHLPVRRAWPVCGCLRPCSAPHKNNDTHRRDILRGTSQKQANEFICRLGRSVSFDDLIFTSYFCTTVVHVPYMEWHTLYKAKTYWKIFL